MAEGFYYFCFTMRFVHTQGYLLTCGPIRMAFLAMDTSYTPKTTDKSLSMVAPNDILMRSSELRHLHVEHVADGFNIRGDIPSFVIINNGIVEKYIFYVDNESQDLIRWSCIPPTILMKSHTSFTMEFENGFFGMRTA